MRVRTRKAHWLATATGIMLSAGALQAGANRAVSNPSVSPSTRARVVETYGRRPLAFEANQGQTDSKVEFLARGDGYGLFLTPAAAVLSLVKPDAGARTLLLRWVSAADPTPRLSGQEEQPGKINYLKGNDPSGWRRNVPIYARVAYEGLYPGIDLIFYGNQRRLEHDYVVAPGADPRRIRFRLEGADRLEIDRAGALVIHLGRDDVRLRKPNAYQDGKAGRVVVPVDYRLIAEGGPGLLAVGFKVGAYDRGTALTIDPILAYSTYLGGSDIEEGDGIAADVAGNAYVTGLTRSPDFPATTGRFTNLSEDAFVTKLDANGQHVFSTYLGGSAGESGRAIALDPAGNIYVAGSTSSPDFPRVHPVQPSPPDPFRGDGFVAKLDPSGSALLYSTNLGGAERDLCEDLAVDSQGNAYVIGDTDSPDFPKVNPLTLPPHSFDPNVLQDTDAFVAKIPPGGGTLVYSTYLGGSGRDDGLGIAVDAAGSAYVTGVTQSTDFPTVNAFQSSYRGGEYDVFVSKLVPSGSMLVYSTYFGGSSRDAALGIAERAGSAYITGDTGSIDFPRADAFQTVLLGGSDAFVARFSPGGALASSTYLGGSASEQGSAIDVDAAGNIYVVGITFSTDFPLRDPVDGECKPSSGTSCAGDAFITKIDPRGSVLLFSTFLGGSAPADPLYQNFSTGRDIATDPAGNIYVTGYTYSLDFPTVDAFQPSRGGGPNDAFVAKISFNRPTRCSAAFASPASLWPPNGKFVPVAVRGVTNPEGDPVAIIITGVRQDEPLSRAGSPDAAGIGTPNVSLRADRDGKGDGRVYRLSFTATDPQGASCAGTAIVCVPHDQGQGRTCGDGGGLFNSGG
jgi:hypothetical protein